MKSKKNYEPPTAQWDELFRRGSVCAASATNESFVDNATPVDWFNSNEN